MHYLFSSRFLPWSGRKYGLFPPRSRRFSASLRLSFSAPWVPFSCFSVCFGLFEAFSAAGAPVSRFFSLRRRFCRLFPPPPGYFPSAGSIFRKSSFEQRSPPEKEEIFHVLLTLSSPPPLRRLPSPVRPPPPALFLFSPSPLPGAQDASRRILPAPLFIPSGLFFILFSMPVICRFPPES